VLEFYGKENADRVKNLAERCAWVYRWPAKEYASGTRLQSRHHL